MTPDQTVAQVNWVLVFMGSFLFFLVIGAIAADAIMRKHCEESRTMKRKVVNMGNGRCHVIVNGTAQTYQLPKRMITYKGKNK